VSLRTAALSACLLVIPAGAAAQNASPGVVVLSGDDWALSDQAFSSLPTDTRNLALNLASLLARPGGRIHAYSDFFAFTGAQLANTLNTAGYLYTVGVGINFDLATLSTFDAVFMGIPLPDPARLEVLKQYVARGGNVYIHAGNGLTDPDLVPNTWNPFLDAFGLRLGRGFNNLVGNIPVVSTHPLFAGVSSVYMQAGHPITGCCSIASSTAGASLFALSSALTYTRYLAEGATGPFFDTRIALLNPEATATTAALQFLRQDGTVVHHSVNVNGLTRVTVNPETIPGLENATFSTVVGSSTLLVVDRTMSWDASGYGSHAETSLAGPAATWYLAEGSTSGDFALFYLLQNPNASAVTATIRYLLPFGQPPIVRSYILPPASRTTIAVDAEGPELASTDVSAMITGTLPIIVERAMYLSRPGQIFAAGHGAAGVTAPATSWFLAEGATGPFFDLFILLANPGDQPAQVSVNYLLLDGTTHSKSYTVPANGRMTIWVDDEQIPADSGIKPLDNVTVSSTITSTNGVPIIAERTMWWPSPALTAKYWTEAHNSAGATTTGTRWALAEGEVGGPQSAETYILIANTSAFAGSARVRLHFEDGAAQEQTFALPARSRTTVGVSAQFPGVNNRRFGAIVESLGGVPAQIVVERAMYTSPGGVTWAAGTNALATLIQTDGTLAACESSAFPGATPWAISAGGNGHLYEVVKTNRDITWEEAQTASAATGAHWHLATVTSAAENAFIEGLFAGDATAFNCCLFPVPLGRISSGPWLGATANAGQSSGWSWLTGEPFGFADWGPLEPFGNGNHISFAEFGAAQTVGWNDISSVSGLSPRAYVKECSPDH